MALNLSYESSNYGLVAAGTYETVLSASFKRAQSGTEYINLGFKIRDDIDQENQNRIVFEKVFKDKETGEYKTKRLQKILSIQGDPKKVPNARYNFDSIEDIIQFINGFAVKIGVKIGEPDEYHEEEYNYITFFAKGEAPQSLTSTTSSPTSTTNVDVNDEDLPF